MNHNTQQKLREHLKRTVMGQDERTIMVRCKEYLLNDIVEEVASFMKGQGNETGSAIRNTD
jgi:hypothetical protein